MELARSASRRATELVPRLSAHPDRAGGHVHRLRAARASRLRLVGMATLAPPFRPASGVALAALVLFGVRAWPAVFAAALVVSFGMTRDPAALAGRRQAATR